MAPLTDAEWAEIAAHELPRTTDDVMQHFVTGRRALMAEEQKQRSGTSPSSHPLIVI